MTTTDDKTPDPTPALLPPARLAEIRERYDAVEIAGPWEAGGPVSPAVASFDDSHYVFPTGDELGPICEASSKARADFIAHAATDTPALLAHLDALTAPSPDDGGEALGREAFRAYPSTPKRLEWAALSKAERDWAIRIGTAIDAAGYARGLAAGRSEGEADRHALEAAQALCNDRKAMIAHLVSEVDERDTEIARLTAELAEAREGRDASRSAWEDETREIGMLLDAHGAPDEQRGLVHRVGSALAATRLDGAQKEREASDTLAAAATALVESLGEYVRQSMTCNPEWSRGIKLIEDALFARRKREADAIRARGGR